MEYFDGFRGADMRECPLNICNCQWFKDYLPAVSVPVDEVLVAATLRRVRHEEARGNRAIHTTTVPVPLDRAIEIGPSGDGLSNALAVMLGRSASEYIAAKIKHRQICGFDDSAVVGKFFVPGEGAAERISELFLGGPRELSVFDLTIERRRFGIALENDRDHFQQAIMEVNAAPLMATTIELATATGDWISVETDVFVPPPFEGKTRGPIRFANAYLEVVLNFDEAQAVLTLNYDRKRKVDIEEAVGIVEVGAILARPEKALTIHFKGTKLELSLGPEVGPFHHWLHAAPTLRRILSAIVRSGRRSRRKVTLREFYNWIVNHAEFLAIASAPGVNMIFPRWSEDGIVDQQDAILTPFSLEFCDAQYTALIEIPIQSASRTEAEITLVGGHPHVVADVVRSPGSDVADFIETAIEKSKRERKSMGPALVAGGFENWKAVILSVS